MTAPRTIGVPRAPALYPLQAFGPYAWLLPEEMWPKTKRFFIYEIDFVTPNQLPASGRATQSVGINRDSYFVAVSIAAYVTNTDNTTVVDQPNILVTIRDAASGFDLMDRPVPFANLFNRGGAGDGKQRFLDLPRIFDPGSTVSATLENFDATARHVRISLIGFRVWV